MMSLQSKDAYIQMLKARMDEWNAELAKLTAKADQAGAKARLEYEKAVKDLGRKLGQVRAKIAELQKAEGNAWEDLKGGLENSWDILKAAFSKARAGFGKGYQEGRKDDNRDPE